MMRIGKISIEGFGLFRGRFELNLPPAIALIVGDNETGKSTLLAALGAILFGFRNEQEKALFAPDNASMPKSGGIEVESRGQTYRFEREFGSNRVKVESLEEGGKVLFDGVAKPAGRTDEKESYDKLLENVFGLDGRDLFYNSVFVQQDCLCADMGGVVRRIVSGTASADYAIARENLMKSYEFLTVEVPWGRSASRKPRLIEQLEAHIRQQRNRLAELREAGATIEQSRERLTEIESELSAIEKTQAELEARERDIASFAEAREEHNRVERELNECRAEMRAIDRLLDEIERCDARIAAEFAEYESFPANADGDILGLLGLRESEKEVEEKLRRAEQSVPRLVVSLSSIAFFAAGLLLAFLGLLFADGMLLAVLALAGLAACAWTVFSALSSLRSRRSAHQGRISEIRETMEEMRRRSAEIERRFPGLAGKDPHRVLRELDERERVERERERKSEALKQHKARDIVEERYNALSNKLVLLGSRVDELKTKHPFLGDLERGGTGSALEETRAEIMRIGERIRALSAERDDLRPKLAAAEAQETVSEEALEEELVENEAELERLKRTRMAYLVAIRTLEEATSEFHSAHLERIEQRTSEYLQRITGAACRVQLGQNLEPILVERAGQSFTPEQLSRGMQDQLHFSLRLAAIEEVCNNVRLPVFLDDPFVSFDENRLKTTLEMLEKLSESHQVALLTHDRRYCDWRPPAHVLVRPSSGSSE